MFERYTETARRAIFFARYEASQFGDDQIKDAHLLLGLLRENNHLFRTVLTTPASPSLAEVQSIVDDLRREVEASLGQPRQRVSTSVDMPLSGPGKRILAYAAEEAERLNHRHIGTEHLLLGMLREEDCVAAAVLQRAGISLRMARERIAAWAPSPPTEPLGRVVAESRIHGLRPAIVEFVCEGEVIASAMVLAVAPIPRAGERVSLSPKPGESTSYRVEDVEYQYDRLAPDAAPAPHQLANVVIRLKRE